MCDELIDKRVADMHERMARLESRLVQLMMYLGADPFGKNDEAGFFDVMEDLLNDQTKVEADFLVRATVGNDQVADAGTGWDALDRPTYLRRRAER